MSGGLALSPFIHLRVHSAYSLLEGAIRVDEIALLCRQWRMPAVAVTDTNNLFGLYDISESLVSAGVQPIVGCTLTVDWSDVVKDHRAASTRKDTAQALARGPLALLVKDGAGFQNLIKLVSKAYLDAAPGAEPHVPFAVLKAHAHGLIALTGGSRSVFNRLLASGQTDSASCVLDMLQITFGDRLYVELQRHGLSAEKQTEPLLIDLAYTRGLPIVATNEPYFAKREDASAHDALLCVAGGTYVLEEERRKETSEHFFKSGEDMAALFADLPEAITATQEIAQRCSFFLEKRAPILPAFKPDSGRDPAAELRFQAEAGLARRLDLHGRFRPDEEYRARLAYELDVIIRMHFAGYFLIVSDFMKWTRSQGIPVGVRGSGAASIVAWALDITSLDPLRFGLVFERFLNPERVSMPDFDIDFCQERRAQVIRYVQDKYGHDRVAQIITFGSLQARAAIRDVGRVLQLPHGQIDRLSKMIRVKPGASIKLSEAIAGEPKMQAAAAAEEAVQRLFDIAQSLEGLYRHPATHAAGVVIGDRPLDELVPLFREPGAAMPVIQLDYEQAEKAGLVKFDFLGLKTLTVIAMTEELIAQRTGVRLRVEDVPFDDSKAFEVLGRGDSTGVFQLESTGMRDLLRKMKPDRIEDLIALVALYRPGPIDNIPKYIACKHGRDKPHYLHPSLEPILSGTYGVMTFQEDVMLIARELAGYSLGQADELRKAMGKKIKEKMAEHRVKFIAGAAERGIPQDTADAIFEQAAKFAGYGFNKAHAAAYGQVAFQTAWLKAHYPLEFLCASMTLDIGQPDRINLFREEALRFGIRVAGPDINRSFAVFSTEESEQGPTIRYALTAIKNVGRQAMDSLVAERERNGPFHSMIDFARRIDPKALNRRALESLVHAGAFDALIAHRAQGLAAIDLMLQEAQAAARARGQAQDSLFGESGSDDEPQLPQVSAWTLPERLSREFDAIGYYFSGHPLDEYAATLRRLHVETFAEVKDDIRRNNRAVTLAATVVSRQDRRTRDDKLMAHIGFSDPTGMFEAVAFSETLAHANASLEPGHSLVVTAAARWVGDDLKLQVQTVKPLAQAALEAAAGLRIKIEDNAALKPVAETLTRFPGRGLASILFRVSASGNDEDVELELVQKVSVSQTLLSQLTAIEGVSRADEL